LIGQTLSHFRITAKLGEGGMGEVYRADDTRLEREVAIKVLPEAVARDPERLARFEREAKVLASLSHPGIAGIHQVEEVRGLHFLVIELVEGEDLAQRIARSPLSTDDAIAVALQIAEALEAAHEKGIVHRDLKPANVMLTPEGQVKVLDFGLAKAFDEGEGGGDAQLTQSPTLTAGMTQAGVILGTAAYMSPEQAVGKPVDKRADIWAFGCLLYEMLSGRHSFEGDSITETLSAIMRDEPGWEALPPSTPPHLALLIRRCVVKDPQKRLRDIGEARIALSDPPDELTLSAEPVTSELPRARGPLVAVAAVALVAGAAASWWLGGRDAPEVMSLAPAIVRITSDPGISTAPTVATAGNLIAYASDRGGTGKLDIWVQPLPSGEPVRVTHGGADDLDPHFSPDGSRIAFRSERDGGGIYTVPALGGAEQLLVPKGRAPRFSPDGRSIAYYTGGRGSSTQIFVVEVATGTVRRLAENFQGARDPTWSPDGRFVLFEGSRASPDGESSQVDWWSITLDDDEAVPAGVRDALGRTQFAAASLSAWVASPERLIFTSQAGDSRSIWQVPFSSSTRGVTGKHHRLTAGTGIDGSPTVVAGEEGSRLYFSSGTRKVNIWRLPIEANRARVMGPPERLTDSVALNIWPSVSADGKRLAFISTRFGSLDVWIKDLETGTEAPVTMTVRPEAMSRISPDGRQVAFVSPSGQYTVPADGGVPSVLTERNEWITDWATPDTLLVRRDHGIARFSLAASTTDQLILEDDRDFYFGVASPDLRWFSFMEWSHPDRTQLFIAPLEQRQIPESEWIAVTEGEHVDEENAWSPDGKLLYYVSERDGLGRCLWAQPLDPLSKRPDGEPLAVLHSHEMRHAIIRTGSGPQNIDVAPDAVYFSMQEFSSNVWKATIEP
jgi:Tol biopolymer transport system component